LKIRGHVALLLVLAGLLVLDPVQRVLVAYARLRAPAARRRILTSWQRWLAHFVLGSFRVVGGARFPELPRVPGDAGTLVLMNHQSVLDIPLVVASLTGSYPRIITRRRYARWIPLISHMVRVYQYPIVDPGANTAIARAQLRALDEAARTSDVPLALFPEGTRTKDGRIGRFRTTGLRRILRARPWTVYVIVGDGYWRHAKLRHFVRGMRDIRGRITLEGPFEWSDPEADPTPFIEEMRALMQEKLAALRRPGGDRLERGRV